MIRSVSLYNCFVITSLYFFHFSHKLSTAYARSPVLKLLKLLTVLMMMVTLFVVLECCLQYTQPVFPKNFFILISFCVDKGEYHNGNSATDRGPQIPKASRKS